MIHYDLRCVEGHTFDGWFASSEAFETQKRDALLACPACGSSAVDRALMAPALARGSTPAPAPATQTPQPEADPGGQEIIPPSRPGSAALLDEKAAEVRKAVRALRKAVETHGVNVGQDFPDEARRIHRGEAEPRGIYGEARPEEAKALVEEGVSVLPIPALPEERN